MPSSIPESGTDRPVSEPSFIAEALSKLLRNRTAIAGLAVVTFFCVLAVTASVIAPHDPYEQSLYDRLKPPFWAEGGTLSNPLGTDDFGRDIFSRIIYGSRISLLIGIISVSISLVFGVVLGSLAGFYRGWADSIIMRLMDIMLAFPAILLAIVVVAILGPTLQNAMIAVGIVYIPHYARIIRASVLAEIELDYVAAARCIGVGNFRMIVSHILPNCLAPLIVQATLGFASAIIQAAGLSFLGLGAQPPLPEWGAMLSGAQHLIIRAWWVLTFPGIAILLTVLGFNLLGDGLRDALDPRLRD